jgi:hypothetical protein
VSNDLVLYNRAMDIAIEAGLNFDEADAVALAALDQLADGVDEDNYDYVVNLEIQRRV